ncbi:MAG: glutamine--fructose-6-phosphate transaminase (isomerizing), partial [Bacteroidota bacterium]|nr:glutamine--fructose-6-phosphate transaminase (isomerizing) [Bacteroidota bacterium]MDX5429560.1 glutamine--fructose-6-phosphate transaminase (isomerizing) [Bacteroidota bacterium]MDX5468347.1 glutamine--fructose-6-phosphate transaminase (isomerizing) [Bacteroidota bacterium]
MCGIVGYIGPKDAFPILIKGLKRLEYRGYDSAGVALLTDKLEVYKKAGKVSTLEEFVAQQGRGKSNIGIGHTRWATHGEPNDRNAHPHLSQNGEIAIIHNGIIENYNSLKVELQQRGHTFLSDTDTEVLVHLIEDIYENNKGVSFEEAVRMALSQVVGAYAVVVLNRNMPDLLIGARKGSPMVIGIGENEHYIASDAAPLVEYTRNVVYLNDGEVAVIDKGELVIKTIENDIKTPYIQELEIHLESIEKGGYDHFMIKEIFEQPKSVYDSIRGRISVKDELIEMAGIKQYEHKWMNLKRLIIVGCGTSWHAGLVGEYLFEDLARIPVEVEYASEFRYRNPVVGEEDMVIAISQSGETADTLAAIELAKSRGATIFGICNVVGASIPRASDAGAYTHAGPEIGVASTKAFTAQVTALILIATAVGQRKGTLTKERVRTLLNELETIPAKIEKTLESNDLTKYIA